MRHLFATAALAELRDFLGGETLVALDYDGTLAPIVGNPDRARMREATRQLLWRLARRRPVVVLTGRSRADALRLLAGTPVMEVIGSHGIETQSPAGTRFLPRVSLWKDILVDRLRQLGGVHIEDKRYSLAVHYRHAADPLTAGDLVGAATGDLPGARVLASDMAWELVPSEAPDKGAALLAACYRLGLRKAIYVGDDDSDEMGFAVGRPGQVFGIRVGRRAGSLARAYLRDQSEIDELLRRLAESALAGARA